MQRARFFMFWFFWTDNIVIKTANFHGFVDHETSVDARVALWSTESLKVLFSKPKP